MLHANAQMAIDRMELGIKEGNATGKRLDTGFMAYTL